MNERSAKAGLRLRGRQVEDTPHRVIRFRIHPHGDFFCRHEGVGYRIDSEHANALDFVLAHRLYRMASIVYGGKKISLRLINSNEIVPDLAAPVVKHLVSQQ